QFNFAQPPKQTQPGWFSFFLSIGKPPRPRVKGGFAIFYFNRAATPPCGGARRGYCAPTIHSHLHRPRLREYLDTLQEIASSHPRSLDSRVQSLLLNAVIWSGTPVCANAFF